MPQSRFFRSGHSTPSSESDPASDDESEPNDNEFEEDVPNDAEPNTHGTARPSTVDRAASADWTTSHHRRNFLMHALLEDRCLNEVLASYSDGRSGRHPSRDSPQIQAEANARYQRLCAQLATYDLISTGLEGDQHAITRQRYLEGLDVLRQQGPNATVQQQSLPRPLTDNNANTSGHGGIQHSNSSIGRSQALTRRTALPLPSRRLLAASDSVQERPAMLTRAFTNSLGQRSLSPSSSILQARYHHDFEELNVLGRGGYGIVYHVRHRLDNQAYAVKKVPLSPARLQRIQKHGEPELKDVLRELRTLARLDHPNIVRYFNGWVEWVDSIAPPALLQPDTASPLFNSESRNTIPGAEDSNGGPQDRVVTESSFDESDIVFESSDSVSAPLNLNALDASVGSTVNGNYSLRRIGSRSTTATVSDEIAESIERQVDPSMSMQSMQSAASSVHFTEPTLAIHLQMSLHPLTLADFLAPPPTLNTDVHAAPPLTHCFHLKPSVSILLAILNGVEYLHREGIVHRDIKPANVFLGPHINPRPADGSVDLMSCDDCKTQNTRNPIRLEVRIGDFGLVTVADPDGVSAPASEAVGTEIYRPPTAQARHPSLDIYALGIVAFELLWKFDTRMERVHTIQKLKQGEFPATFAERLGKKRGEAMKECIEMMVAEDGNGISISELKDRLAAISL